MWSNWPIPKFIFLKKCQAVVDSAIIIIQVFFRPDLGAQQTKLDDESKAESIFPLKTNLFNATVDVSDWRPVSGGELSIDHSNQLVHLLLQVLVLFHVRAGRDCYLSSLKVWINWWIHWNSNYTIFDEYGLL